MKQTIVLLLAFLCFSCATTNKTTIDYTLDSENDRVLEYSQVDYVEITSKTEKDKSTLLDRLEAFVQGRNNAYLVHDIKGFDDIEPSLDTSATLSKEVEFIEYTKNAELNYNEESVQVSTQTKTESGTKTEYVQDKKTKSKNSGIKFGSLYSMFLHWELELEKWERKVAQFDLAEWVAERKQRKNNN